MPGRVCGEEAERAAITQQQEDENCMAAANGCREGRRPFAESRDSVSGRVWGSAPRSLLYHCIQCHHEDKARQRRENHQTLPRAFLAFRQKLR